MTEKGLAPGTLPILVISELLGIPEADRNRFHAWSRALISGFGRPQFPVDAAVQQLHYLRVLIADKRNTPTTG